MKDKPRHDCLQSPDPFTLVPPSGLEDRWLDSWTGVILLEATMMAETGLLLFTGDSMGCLLTLLCGVVIGFFGL